MSRRETRRSPPSPKTARAASPEKSRKGDRGPIPTLPELDAPLPVRIQEIRFGSRGYEARTVDLHPTSALAGALRLASQRGPKISDGLAGRSTCCSYCSAVITLSEDFHGLDSSYLREYKLSGMCRKCQDAFFGATSEEG